MKKIFQSPEIIGCGDTPKTPDEAFEEYSGEVDLIFAGFPCQGFSQAGKKLPDDPEIRFFKPFQEQQKLVKPKVYNW